LSIFSLQSHHLKAGMRLQDLSFLLGDHLDGVFGTFIGADAAALAETVIDLVVLPIYKDTGIGAEHSAQVALDAQMGMHDGPEASPCARFVLQRRSAFNGGTDGEFHRHGIMHYESGDIIKYPFRAA